MRKAPIILAIFVMYVLHQDVWFWRTPQPIVGGILPIGLAYHAAYTALVSLLMWGLVKYAWPKEGS